MTPLECAHFEGLSSAMFAHFGACRFREHGCSVRGMDAIKETQKLRDRIVKHRGNYMKLCAAAKIGRRWLDKFLNGDYDNPSFKRYCALVTALDTIEKNGLPVAPRRRRATTTGGNAL